MYKMMHNITKTSKMNLVQAIRAIGISTLAILVTMTRAGDCGAEADRVHVVDFFMWMHHHADGDLYRRQ